MKTGILLLNFGGPDTNDEVVPFLYNLFSDPNVLVGIPAPVRQILAYLISRIKGPSSRRSYALIGGGSPQLRWTRLQVDGLRHALKKTGRDVPVSVGMRVWRPPIRQTLDELRAAGIEHLILLPLFPQYSTTTSKTCLEEVETQLKKMDWRPKRTTITSWPDFPPYIALLRRTVDEAVAEASRHPEPV
ncbi:MAG: ferrochelatase, partial [Bacteriovoracia bacterium]